MNRLHLACLIFAIGCVSMSGCGEDVWIKKGKELIVVGDYERAIEHFQQLLEEKPKNPEAYYQLGLVYLKLGQHNQAIEVLRIATRAAPHRLDVQLALGEVYMAVGHRKLARGFFLRVLQESKQKDWIQKIGRLTGDAYKTIRLTPDYVQVFDIATAANRIAFTAFVDDNNEIYTMDIEGKNKKRLTFNDTSDYNPTLSSDGKKVIYISFIRWHNSNDEIFVMDIDGGKPKRLTANTVTDSNPTFSPDGKRITFGSNTTGNSEIHIMDADGKNQKRLTYTETDNNAPAFSPDNRQIAFAAYDVGPSKNSESPSSYGVFSQICVIDNDGKNFRELTDVEAINANPSFSPDGKNIVFDSNRDGDAEIFIMDVDGKNQIQLTHNDYMDIDPMFTSDGKRIFFVGQREKAENLGVHVMDLERPFTKQEILERIE